MMHPRKAVFSGPYYNRVPPANRHSCGWLHGAVSLLSRVISAGSLTILARSLRQTEYVAKAFVLDQSWVDLG